MFDLIAQVINPLTKPAHVQNAPIGNEPQEFSTLDDLSFIFLPRDHSGRDLAIIANSIKKRGWTHVVFCSTIDRAHPIATAKSNAWIKALISLPVDGYILTEF